MHPVQVALPVPLAQCFTYLAPEEVSAGALVQVPFGKRTLWGVVWQAPCQAPGPEIRLKPIHKVHPTLALSSSLRHFLEKMASYTLSPLGSVLKMTLPELDYSRLDLLVPALLPGPPPSSKKSCPTDAQLQAFHKASSVSAPPSFWQDYLGISWAKLRKWIPSFLSPHAPAGPFAIQARAPLSLSPGQLQAFLSAQKLIDDQNFAPFLLEGVTGSGKTEIALALCHHVWQQGKQVLVLLPEIALSHQWEKRCQTYFQNLSSGLSLEACGMWHSGLSGAMRQKVFEGLTQGTLPLVIGARSALCLPYRNLGLVIVDEEHDLTYKQSEGVLYHGRDMAVMRAFCEHLPIALLSATPSLETRNQVLEGKYHHIHLAQRYGQSQLPSLHLIDMRPHPPKDKAWVSPPLRKALIETYAQGHQSLLFLNRRGYACIFLCFRCGYRGECPHCSAWLSVHTKKAKQLLCHHCGFCQPLPSVCPRCHEAEGLVAAGAGIEKIQEEVLSFLPQARIELFSSDHIHSSASLESLLARVSHREIDIVIGTQLVAKGHHFPHLTCIGVIDTDSAFMDMDFRARERLFQLLFQVSGRAGRGHAQGHAYLQTLQPNDPFFHHLATYNVSQFVESELERRRQQHLPPYTRFAFITLSGLCEWAVQAAALALQEKAPSHSDLTLWGPAPAPLSPLRRRHRWRFILKAPKKYPLQAQIQKWLESCPLSKGIKVESDIDPYHFL